MAPSVERFYGEADRVYELDEYTRFVLMEEVIREYVGSVYLRKEEDQYVFKVRNFGNQLRIFDDNPLMLVDGVPVFSTKEIMALDPLKIKRIELAARHYFYGPVDCKGILSFETYEGDLDGLELNQGAMRLNYQGLEQERSLNNPDYDKNASRLERIPDFRTQLLWEPQVELSGDQTILQFYTSDVTGQFEVVVRAIDDTGQLVEGVKEFEIID